MDFPGENTETPSRGERQPVVALIGPTAVGKTALSLELALRLGAEIISVDSRQVYRYMDVGTDKIAASERRRVPHHAVDVADPDEVFTVSDFVSLALGAVRRIRARGRVPLFVGGTPFYYNALFHAAMNVSLPQRCGAATRNEPRWKDPLRFTPASPRSTRSRRTGCTPTTSAASCARWRSGS